MLIKDVSETFKNKVKEQRSGFLSVLVGTLGASSLGNILTGKVVMRTREGTISADQYF